MLVLFQEFFVLDILNGNHKSSVQYITKVCVNNFILFGVIYWEPRTYNAAFMQLEMFDLGDILTKQKHIERCHWNNIDILERTNMFDPYTQVFHYIHFNAYSYVSMKPYSSLYLTHMWKLDI